MVIEVMKGRRLEQRSVWGSDAVVKWLWTSDILLPFEALPKARIAFASVPFVGCIGIRRADKRRSTRAESTEFSRSRNAFVRHE